MLDLFIIYVYIDVYAKLAANEITESVTASKRGCRVCMASVRVSKLLHAKHDLSYITEFVDLRDDCQH